MCEIIMKIVILAGISISFIVGSAIGLKNYFSVLDDTEEKSSKQEMD